MSGFIKNIMNNHSLLTLCITSMTTKTSAISSSFIFYSRYNILPCWSTPLQCVPIHITCATSQFTAQENSLTCTVALESDWGAWEEREGAPGAPRALGRGGLGDWVYPVYLSYRVQTASDIIFHTSHSLQRPFWSWVASAPAAGMLCTRTAQI